MGRNKTFNLDVDAFISDERLNECSANAHGVYIRTMCVMHKSQDYGKIYLGQMSEDPVETIVERLLRQMPFSKDEIRKGITELILHNVIYLENGYLCQGRMIRDNELAQKRSEAGRSGMSRRWAVNGTGRKIEPKVEQVTTEPDKTPEKVSETIPEVTPPKPPRTDYTSADMEKDVRSLGITRQTAKDWMKNRKGKKLPPTKTAFEDVKRELLSHPEFTPEEQLKMAAVNGWGGYKFKWFIREKQDGNNNSNNDSNDRPGAQTLAGAVPTRNYDEGF